MQILQPVETLADFRALDEGEIFCGYLDGLNGEQCSPSTASRAYWHGWRNGLVDGGYVEPDAAQLKLENAFASLRERN